jgi:hypothetical protein
MKQAITSTAPLYDYHILIIAFIGSARQDRCSAATGLLCAKRG